MQKAQQPQPGASGGVCSAAGWCGIAAATGHQQQQAAAAAPVGSSVHDFIGVYSAISCRIVSISISRLLLSRKTRPTAQQEKHKQQWVASPASRAQLLLSGSPLLLRVGIS